MSERDPYEVLGVRRTASRRHIRVAYVERARQLHPDIVGPRGLEGMRELNEAWEVLKDAPRRAAYDLATGGHSSATSTSESPYGGDDPTRPFWTGAMGPPPGRPWGPKLDFGIYDRWSVGEIARSDPGYLMWLRDRPEARVMLAEIDKLISPATDEQPGRRRGGRR